MLAFFIKKGCSKIWGEILYLQNISVKCNCTFIRKIEIHIIRWAKIPLLICVCKNDSKIKDFLAEYIEKEIARKLRIELLFNAIKAKIWPFSF